MLVKKFFLLLSMLLLLVGCKQIVNNKNINLPAQQLLSGSKIDNFLFVKDDQIYLSNKDGSNTLNLSKNNKINFSPLWTQEGESVFFASDNSGYYEFWQKNLLTDSLDLLWGSKKYPELIKLSPDRLWMVFAEEEGCFLFNLEDKKAQRFADECTSVAWAQKDKKFVYAQDNILYLMELNIKKELSKPKELFKGIINAPVFIDNKTLVFQSMDDETSFYNLYKLSLLNSEPKILTDLNFPNIGDAVLKVSPNGKKLAYKHLDFNNKENNVWLVSLYNVVTAKKVLTDVYDVAWTLDNDFYFSQNNNIYSASEDGLNKKEIIPDGLEPVFFHNI